MAPPPIGIRDIDQRLDEIRAENTMLAARIAALEQERDRLRKWGPYVLAAIVAAALGRPEMLIGLGR